MAIFMELYVTWVDKLGWATEQPVKQRTVGEIYQQSLLPAILGSFSPEIFHREIGDQPTIAVIDSRTGPV